MASGPRIGAGVPACPCLQFGIVLFEPLKLLKILRV